MKGLFAERGVKGLILITVVLICGFLVFRGNVKPVLEASVSERALVLSRDLPVEDFASHLLTQGYFDDTLDARCVSEWIITHMGRKPMKNLGALNKDPYRIPVAVADSLGGPILKLRSYDSRLSIGQDDEFRLLHKESLASSFSVHSDSTYKIPITVRKENPAYSGLTGMTGRIKKRIYRTLKDDYYLPVRDVVVRITEYDLDNREGVPVGYMKTDGDGSAVFEGKAGHYYSLLPVADGYEYGSSVGTRGMEKGLTQDLKPFVRTQREHSIRVLDSSTYGHIKEDHSLIVRSASSFDKTFFFSVFLFLAAWWLFYLLLGMICARKGRKADYLLPLLLMTITGIDVLCMFSIADPLTDSLLGKDTVTGTIIGLALMGLLSAVNWERFHYNGFKLLGDDIDFDFVLQFIRYVEKPFPEKVSTLQEFTRNHRTGSTIHWILVILRYYICLLLSVLLLPLEWIVRLVSYFPKKWGFALPKGSGYLVIVLLFIFLLALFGDGPEGSGTKVNLFFFQPSELNKFLVVVFMAVFFSVNASRIQSFSKELSIGSLKMQGRTVLFILVSIVVLLGLYMVVMSDMGPALVITVTFIFLYSIARKDVGPMLFGIATYLGLVYLAKLLPGNPLWGQILASVVWLLLWVAGGYLFKRRLYESAVFFNAVVFAFLAGGGILTAIGMESEGQRLLDRQQVAESLWNNDVVGGGDQVVQGIWSLATGGLIGQGLGKGDPNLVPAFNTDMIFTSIGEEMGFIALLLLVICIAVLLHRCLIIGYWSGDSFLFFLASGIAVVTGVQFFVIVLGSIGVIPLTGVAVPFLSYGMTSLILNLGAMGIIISISGRKVEAALQDENAGYSKDLSTASVWGFLVLSLVVLGFLFNYQCIGRDHYLIKEAYVCNDMGAKVQEYNPRINRLLRRLEAGRIYDRNRLLLATSDRGELLKAWSEAEPLFAGSTAQEKLSERSETLRRRYLQRYYPFGDYLYFMLGDINTMTLWGIDDNNPFGYLAESRHRTELVGFETARREDGELVFKGFDAKQNVSPFLPPVDTTYSFLERDYSNRRFLRMLKQGSTGRAVERWNEQKHKRDMFLTVDARLQTLMEERMSETVPALQERVNQSLRVGYSAKDGREKPTQKVRASAVVLDVASGDLLTSAVFPLPNQDSIRTLLNRRKDYLTYEKEPTARPFTDRDLGLTFQTAPGSTAKVIASIAAFMKLGNDAPRATYTVTPEQAIHDTPGIYNLETGLVNSINCYFINLVQDKDLYPELDTLYSLIGARIGDDRERIIQKSYFFDMDEFSPSQKDNYNKIVDAVRGRAVPLYHNYVETRSTHRMNYGDWGWAWGQGTLDASPLNIARAASIVASGGTFTPTRYVLATGNDKDLEMSPVVEPVRVFSRHNAETLQGIMRKETDKRRIAGRPLPHTMGGKTGTPERGIKFLDDFTDGDRFNDAWYMCFVDVIPPEGPFTKGTPSPRRLAIAVRIERTYKLQSTEAANLVSWTVVPALRDAGYQVLDELP